MSKKLEVCPTPVAPLLAGTVQTLKGHKKYEKENASFLRYPLVASPKLDGLRCLVIGGQPYTREMNLFPNKYVQSIIDGRYEGLDGELIVGEPVGEMVYRRSHSGVMSEDGEPDFTFWVFDYHNHGEEDPSSFGDRYHALTDGKVESRLPKVKLVPHKLVSNEEELLAFELQCIEAGYEGIMLRDPEGLYKNGRSSFKQHILLKLKRFEQDEAEVIGFKERMHNGNEATINALGHTERSSHAENKVGRGDLGALIVRTKDGKEFPIGTGFNDKLRTEIYQNQEEWLGKWVTFKYFAYGDYDLPRHPVFHGIRAKEDMSNG